MVKFWMSALPGFGSLLVALTSVNAPAPDWASLTVTVTVTGTSFLFGGQMLDGLAVAVHVGAVASMRTTATFSDPSAAPVLGGIAPSVAEHVITWSPPPETLSATLALPVPAPAIGPCVSPPALSVHVMLATLDASVAVAVPRTGVCHALNYPPWPAGGAGKVTVTAGRVVSAGGVETITAIASSTACPTFPAVPSKV